MCGCPSKFRSHRQCSQWCGCKAQDHLDINKRGSMPFQPGQMVQAIMLSCCMTSLSISSGDCHDRWWRHINATRRQTDWICKNTFVGDNTEQTHRHEVHLACSCAVRCNSNNIGMCLSSRLIDHGMPATTLSSDAQGVNATQTT
eukprot:5909140-Amphidinium_carterae.1